MNPGTPGEQQFPLSPGTITIGRTKDNAVICLHKSLSRKHAQVEFDGVRVTITDLQSKNGVFVNGARVERCELTEGDRFRCGDITFLVEGTTLLSTKVSSRGPFPTQTPDRSVQTLPSPFALDPNASRRPAVRSGPAVTIEGEQRYKDKLFLLVRASELCVRGLPIDELLDELVALAVQALDVDRIALFTRDDGSPEMRPRVIKTFVAAAQYPYSTRVLDWVVDHGSPTSFADVSRDRTLLGDLARDANVRGAMCVPINPGGGAIGAIYVDSLSRPDCFGPDDLALLRALANLAAVALESAASRANDRHGVANR